MKYKNIILIGMPGSGKSTIGKKLAKRISFNFIDTDKYIEKLVGKGLTKIFKEEGGKGFKKKEEESILRLNLNNHIISTGGSVVLSPVIMNHLKKNGLILYLHLDYSTIRKRVGRPYSRAVVGSENNSLKEIYYFRLPFYKKYADKTFFVKGKSVKEILKVIISELGKSN